jgi:hypothetical protein
LVSRDLALAVYAPVVSERSRHHAVVDADMIREPRTDEIHQTFAFRAAPAAGGLNQIGQAPGGSGMLLTMPEVSGIAGLPHEAFFMIEVPDNVIRDDAQKGLDLSAMVRPHDVAQIAGCYEEVAVLFVDFRDSDEESVVPRGSVQGRPPLHYS